MILLFILLASSSALHSMEHNQNDPFEGRPQLKQALQSIYGNELKIDLRILAAFKTVNAFHQAKKVDFSKLARNELTGTQYYRWRLFTSLNSYGLQLYESLYPKLKEFAALVESDSIDKNLFLKYSCDFFNILKGEKSSAGDKEIVANMQVNDLVKNEAALRDYISYFQYIYKTVGDSTYEQAIGELLPNEFGAISPENRRKIETRAYLSSVSMLYDFILKYFHKAEIPDCKIF